MAEILQFRKAQRKKAKARIGISGPAGSGKTYSALLIAMGLGGRIAMIDTENGSGELYSHLIDYDVLIIRAPFTPERYIAAIKAAEEKEYDTAIIDSLSHGWAGEGGLLEHHGRIVDSGKANSYAAWRTVTPKHNELVEAMLQSKCHIIATMRSKMEYAIQQNNGKNEVLKVGMGVIQRDGMEYEFTVFFELSQRDHSAEATKDRTMLFDGKIFRPTVDTGKILKAWLDLDAAACVETSLQRTEVIPMTNHKSGPKSVEAETTKIEETAGATTALPEVEIMRRIRESMAKTSSEKELEEICDSYRLDFEGLSDKTKKALMVEKKAIKQKLRVSSAA